MGCMWHPLHRMCSVTFDWMETHESRGIYLIHLDLQTFSPNGGIGGIGVWIPSDPFAWSLGGRIGIVPVLHPPLTGVLSSSRDSFHEFFVGPNFPLPPGGYGSLGRTVDVGGENS